jgi:hypothetical protein
MKIGVILILAGMGVLGRAQGESDADSSMVTVCLQGGIDDPILRLNWAKTIASSIFAQAGVRIKWQSGQSNSVQALTPIVLSFTSNTPEKFPPNIFAYALVYEGVHIRIFVDHVVERAHHETPLATYLLAHVMVHEITHMLEGFNGHSRGIRFSLAPDGKSIAYSVADLRSSIWLLEGFEQPSFLQRLFASRSLDHNGSQ